MSAERVATVILGAPAVLAGAVLHARFWPLKVCWRCKGAKELSPGGRVRRVCPSCGGTGRQRRFLAPRR